MRPEILYPLFTPLTSLKGVGSKIAPLLARVAGARVRDLLFLGPQSIVRRAQAKVADAVEGEVQIFHVSIIGHLRPERQSMPWRIRAYDGTAFLTLIYFKGHGAHLERAHPQGAQRIVSGRVERFGSETQIVHPDYLIDVARAEEIPEVEPIYPATAGLTSRTVRKLAQEAMALAPDLPEWQDGAWLERQRWPAWRAALGAYHAPGSEADLSAQSPHQLALAQRRSERRAYLAPAIVADGLAARLECALPFRLTGAQQKALAEIRADLASGQRMTRLLQGDVGAGKTVVAMLAMADAASAGLQSALMAPTEILARQHYEALAGPLGTEGVGAVLLTGRDKGAARAEKLARLADGSALVMVGTHALVQDDVAFRSLSLTVIDEQHRFGVTERARLQTKGESAHLLAMSATPIPRTLELTLYGDLDISRLDEKPPGRRPVVTRAAPMPRLDEIVARLGTAVRSGAQAFWICPLISDSELVDLAAAESRATALSEALGRGVGLIHGRLPAATKDAVMADFVGGKISVLVATTVIEVGVDVPAASIMVIEQAERFGLAQLHQLRGRVGRGAAESSCVLLYDPPLSDIATRRLDVLRQSDDGFLIAEMDLDLRGGGDPLGLRQSGFPAYRLADPVAHRDLIAAAADDARLILHRDPTLTSTRGQALGILRELFDWKIESSINEAG
jgi:ATP-dependent DNA helicase RecG